MPILITDFDGTFAQRDFFDLILERYDSPAGRAGWQKFTDGHLTLSEGLNAVFSTLRTNEAAAEELVQALNPAPGTAEAVRDLQKAGWEIIVASAGCSWYIHRLLEHLNLDITVHASPGVFSPATGLIMSPDPSSPYFHPKSGIDKAVVVREALARDGVVAYAGDSTTDRAGALMVPPERRFVTGWLQRQFTQEDLPHIAFSAWPEIAVSLLNG